MLLWVEERSYEPTDFEAIQALSLDRPWLVPVAAFLKFWFSDEPEWTTETSGSTSAPKSISISRARIEASASSTILFFDLKPETDGFILCLSARHVGGFMVLARALLGGFDVWMLEPTSNPIPETNPVLKHRKWFISLVPMQLEAFRVSTNLQNQSANWNGLLLGGTALTFPQMELIKLVHCPVYQSYGMTETVSHIAIRPLNTGFSAESPYSALPGIEIKTGENQCLAIKGAVTDFEWLQTRDRVEIQNATQFVYLGRADEMINSGGFKMDPTHLKKMYMQLVDWREEEFEVVGLNDDILGKKVVLVFRSPQEENRSDRFEMEVQKLGQTISSLYLPKAIYWVEHFPLTPTFKLDRPSLSQQLAHLQPVWEKPGAGLSKKNG